MRHCEICNLWVENTDTYALHILTNYHFYHVDVFEIQRLAASVGASHQPDAAEQPVDPAPTTTFEQPRHGVNMLPPAIDGRGSPREALEAVPFDEAGGEEFFSPPF